jgi:hypothetical protein
MVCSYEFQTHPAIVRAVELCARNKIQIAISPFEIKYFDIKYQKYLITKFRHYESYPAIDYLKYLFDTVIEIAKSDMLDSEKVKLIVCKNQEISLLLQQDF